jgi:hypothetical protein
MNQVSYKIHKALEIVLHEFDSKFYTMHVSCHSRSTNKIKTGLEITNGTEHRLSLMQKPPWVFWS